MIIVSFQTEFLRDACRTRAAGEDAFGPGVADRLFAMLADMEAAEELGELLPIYGDDAVANEDDSLSIRFSPEFRATFEAVDAKRPVAADGKVDWARVRRLKLIKIEAGDG